jgi:hypothetical protein
MSDNGVQRGTYSVQEDFEDSTYQTHTAGQETCDPQTVENSSRP